MTQSPGPYPEPTEAPREATAAAVIFIVLAAILAFFGGLYLVQVDSLTESLRTAMQTSGQTLPLTDAQIGNVIRVMGVVLLLIGVANGLTAQGLWKRRKWCRPLGYTMAGILVAFALLAVLSGDVPVILVGLLAGSAIFLLSKPAVRSYLSNSQTENMGVKQ